MCFVHHVQKMRENCIPNMIFLSKKRWSSKFIPGCPIATDSRIFKIVFSVKTKNGKTALFFFRKSFLFTKWFPNICSSSECRVLIRNVHGPPFIFECFLTVSPLLRAPPLTQFLNKCFHMKVVIETPSWGGGWYPFAWHLRHMLRLGHVFFANS